MANPARALGVAWPSGVEGTPSTGKLQVCARSPGSPGLNEEQADGGGKVVWTDGHFPKLKGDVFRAVGMWPGWRMW